MSKKVLIVHATGGMGHVTAARAIEEALKKNYPEVEVQNVDIISFASDVYKKVFVGGYNFISAHLPKIWGWLYAMFNKPSRQDLPTELSEMAIKKRFLPFIQEFKPDFIVATHPLPARLISNSKRDDLITIPSSLVVTDFGCHSYWIDEQVNYYFVATADVGMCLQNYEVAPEKIVAAGIPILPKFSESLSRETVAKKYGLDPTKPVLLIVGGQFSFDTLAMLLEQISSANAEVQFLVVAGRDKALEEKLKADKQFKNNPRIKIFGFVGFMEELMSAADLIFSKAGGLTVSECMAKGLPMIINKVIPGQEEDNVNYLVSKGAAIQVDTAEQIVTEVVSLLNDQERLKAMKQACRAIGRPHSAEDVAAFIVEHC